MNKKEYEYENSHRVEGKEYFTIPFLFQTSDSDLTYSKSDFQTWCSGTKSN